MYRLGVLLCDSMYLCEVCYFYIHDVTGSEDITTLLIYTQFPTRA
jgi:hypothetical protein